jgi:hypothetical protein
MTAQNFKHFAWQASRLAILFVALIVLTVNLSLRLWHKPDQIIHDDVISYYQYLPAVFIFKDISLRKYINIKDNDEIRIWVKDPGTGKGVGKMTIGMAVMYFPFFITVHALAKPLGYNPNGFSPPYKLALILSSVFYLTIGLIFLRSVLKRYFADWIVAWVLIFTVMGTNLLYYTVFEPAMSHTYSFCLFAAFLFFLVRWLDAPVPLRALPIGLITGLIILVRPVNIILLLLIPFWEIESPGQFISRMKLLFNKWHQVILMVVMAGLVILPQLLYWKTVTGHYFYYGYGEERFFFNNPQFIRGLFSYKKGWLVYTPVMWFAIAGLIVMAFRNRKLFYPIVLFMMVNMYIVFSWWCWYGGGSFGMRFLIESYVLMAIAMAAFVKWISGQRWFFKLPAVLFAFIFLVLNLFQTAQYKTGAIHNSSMTKRAYWETFLKLYPTTRFYNVTQEYDVDKAFHGIYEELLPLDQDRERFIIKTEKDIRANEPWMKQMREKAGQRVPVDTVIHRDAVWIWEQQHENQK